MTTNARDEKWSEWWPNRGVQPNHKTVEVKFDDGSTDIDDSDMYFWPIDGDSCCDIIAYRYKIKEPESDMHPDLKKCAQYEWNGNFDRVTWNHSVAGPEWFNSKYFTGKDGYKRSEHSAARQQLGLDSNGIAEPDEEECLQLAYERMGDESLPTSVKQLRYQDAKGEDWIDEFSRTATVDEFRGAMRFTIGKYNRRAGKKDELIKEIEKMRDYCERWLEYERKVGQ